MKIHIKSSGVEVTEAVRAHVELRLGLALGRFAERIGIVAVRFVAAGAEPGGWGISCRIDIRLLPVGKVRVEATNSELFAIIDHATERVSRQVALALEHAAPFIPPPSSRPARSKAPAKR